MSNIIQDLEQQAAAVRPVPRFRTGDLVRVHVRIKEGAKERIQVFEGTVIAWRSAGLRTTMTVRKVSYGVGVERIFPVYSPTIEKIQWVRRGRVRRAKLYYIRKLRGRKARLREVRNAAAPTVD